MTSTISKSLSTFADTIDGVTRAVPDIFTVGDTLARVVATCGIYDDSEVIICPAAR